MIKERNILIPRWFLEVVEDTLRIQNNINIELDKGTGETCQDRNVKQSLNGIRKLLKGEELTGMERLEKLQPSLPSGLDKAAEEYAIENKTQSGLILTENIEAFKAGAEWMARQGETVEGEVVSTSTDGWECVRLYKKLHSVDDEVIVQIRKK